MFLNRLVEYAWRAFTILKSDIPLCVNDINKWNVYEPQHNCQTCVETEIHYIYLRHRGTQKNVTAKVYEIWVIRFYLVVTKNLSNNGLTKFQKGTFWNIDWSSTLLWLWLSSFFWRYCVNYDWYCPQCHDKLCSISSHLHSFSPHSSYFHEVIQRNIRQTLLFPQSRPSKIQSVEQ